MKFVGQTAENDICSTRLGQRSCLRGTPSCHGLMSAKLPWAVAIFSRAKRNLKASFVLLFFFLSSFFPSSFWRRVTRLTPSYWTILVKQILNQWMNLRKSAIKYYTFSPKPDWRLGGDRKTTGETQRYTKVSHLQVILDSKKIISPKMTGEGKIGGLQRVSKKFSLTSNSR